MRSTSGRTEFGCRYDCRAALTDVAGESARGFQVDSRRLIGSDEVVTDFDLGCIPFPGGTPLG